MALEYPNYADKAVFVDLLAEGSAAFEPVKQQELDAWIQGPEISFTVATDLPGAGQRILKDFSPTDQSYLVELESRRIVAHAQAPAEMYAAIEAL